MDTHSAFDFHGDAFLVTSDDFVARVRPSIEGKGALLSALAQELKFPEYFGGNWDALWDCICDLSWIPSFRVVLFHADLPRLRERELSVYLELLRDSVKDWKPSEQHELCVVFPPACRDVIEKIPPPESFVYETHGD